MRSAVSTCDCCRRGERTWRLEMPGDHLLHCLWVCDDCLARGLKAIRASVELRMAAARAFYQPS